MPYEVKMPQLGMNQDSAVIVSWLKAAGDKVAKGDVIFEVETDKATMEVEAAADGFLAGIVAGEGDDVPVGDLIALIVESESEVADHTATPEARREAPDQVRGMAVSVDAEPEAVPPPATRSEAARAPKPGPRLAGIATGKVLASPLAKRLAGERGINLEALRAQGVAEPIHAADLSTAPAGGRSHLGAKVDGGALDALLGRSEGADRTALFAAFAAGGWRAVFGEEVAVAIHHLDGSGGTSDALALRLVDLCDTKLNTYAPAGGGITLTVVRDGAGYGLTLSFAEGSLPLARAIALLDAIAARVEDPIRQLL